MGICIEITSCPATSLVQPSLHHLPFLFRLSLSLSLPFLSFFFSTLHPRAGAARSIFQFAVPEVERSRRRRKPASLLATVEDRGEGVAKGRWWRRGGFRASSLFFPVNGEERASSVGSRSRLQPPPPPARNRTPFTVSFVPFLLLPPPFPRRVNREREQSGTSVLEQRGRGWTRRGRKWWKDGTLAWRTWDRTRSRAHREKQRERVKREEGRMERDCGVLGTFRWMDTRGWILGSKVSRVCGFR